MVSDSSPPASDAGPIDILNRMGDGFLAVDTDWNITYANEEARTVIGEALSKDRLAESLEGRILWGLAPDAVDTVFHDRFREAMDTQEPVPFQAEYEPLEMWFDVQGFPSESGLSIYFVDITEQKRLWRDRQESLHALQRLYAITADRSRGFDEKLEAILGLGCGYLDLSNGFLTRIDGQTQYIERAVGDHPGLQAGESCPLDEAYCKRTIELEELLTVVNAADDEWSNDPAYDRFGLGPYIGGRIVVDHSLYGTLCFADADPRGEAFKDTERTFVELLTRWASYELERRRVEARLTLERDRLDEFASVVSHDLRNPLNVALGQIDMLEETVESEHVPPLSRALGRMGQLIDELLLLARGGQEIEEPEDLELAAVADAAWATVGTGDATLVNELGDLRVFGDESRVRQLFENLFRNAIEHGEADVTVTTGPLETEPGFYVADDGPGIPPDERDRVFDAGYTTAGEGTGLGLSIVQKIAGAHDWDVEIVGADGGARFEITGIRSAS